ncbi:MAG TPA: T9SS type A sorting domain-containing protein, partial [Chitinophagaceae bacterium]|nr:T9SS type A sorting domain-containing protein [Chitinophagaceae bacterium]
TNRIDIGLYPNPASSKINITIASSRKEKIDYQVFDNTGRIVKRETNQLLSGTNRLSVDINKLPAGVYYIYLSSTSINRNFEFVKYN